MKSNLKINSNVFLRKLDTGLAEDKDFLPHIRGSQAVRKFLWKAFEIADANSDDAVIKNLLRQNKLTEAQFNALKWEIVCHQCQSIPVGLTFRGTVEFRCQQTGCK